MPSGLLRADVSYRLVVSGVRDTDGLPLEQAAVAVHTTTAPTVVRFRPVANSTLPTAGTRGVGALHVADVLGASTARAFSIRVGGKSVAGSVHWAEDDAVLVFDPKAALPYGAKVSMSRRAPGIRRGCPSPSPPMPSFTLPGGV